MILHQPRGEDEVDRQIISMLYDAVVVGTISSGNYRRIFFGDNNKNGVAGNQEVTARSTFSIRTSHSRNCCAYISVQVKVPWRVYFHVYYHDFKQEIGIQGGIDYRSVFRVEDSTPMLKRPKLLQPKATATSEEQRSFNDIFERFRIVVFKKLSRNADLKKNNEILKSVFMNLYEMVNKTGDRPGLNLIEFKVSVYKIFPGFKLDEIRRLFLYFDTDRNGRITVEEFIIGIKTYPITTKGKLNAYRERLVHFVFHLLDTNGNGLIEENELTEYLQRTNMPKILSGTALPPHVKSKELIRKICSEDGAYNAISFADLQEFYIDRGVFTTDDLTFKQELLDDWLFSEELCDQYLQNNSPNTVTSTASESPPLPKRGELVPRVSFSSFIGPGKSPGDSHDVSASNSPRRRVYSTPPAPTSPTNSVQRSREISVRARIGIVSAVDGTIQDAQKTGCDKYDYNNTQQHESESTSISSQLKIVQQQRDILAQQVLIDQYYSHQIDQTNQNLGQGGLNSGLASGTGSGLGGTGSGSGYIQHPQQLAEKNNSGGGIGSLYIQDRVLGPSLDSDNINCLRSNGLHTSSNLKTETQIKMEQQRLLLRQQKQIMEKMKLSMIQHLGEDKPMLQLQQQQDGAQIVNQGSNLCSPQQQQQQQQREIPHAPGTPRLNYSYINTSMRGGALASARVNQTSPEISVVPFTKEDHLELIKAIGALKNEVRDKNTKIEHIERLLVEYDQKKKENDRLLSMQESDIQEQQNMIQSQQHLIQAQQNMISKMQSTNSSSYDKYNVT